MEQLLNKLQSLGNRAKTVENQAVKAGAEILRNEIAARTPRSSSPRQPDSSSQSWRTGQHAADNIKISGVKQKDGAKIIEVGIQKGDRSHYFYLKFLEWGTTKISAQHFMASAVAEKRTEATRKVHEIIKRALNL
ncbi:phage protein, HK97 gp10 family [Aneurinibacillus aneurinilyticus ATCC 12856]|uniref:Phage protein, HK97 gp10 family n=2 Tax=Aneurinibacillus aneurinilyticus TaxID=1391 RepID=U1WQL9_ANEAE|nr:phage protein, HK97 gp10 family [Aneurinibacillus aneurinilyticus ATCC 12856]